jgi:hypothetical protein
VTSDDTQDPPVTRKRRRVWAWAAAVAVGVLAPAGWLGAEYALDNEQMAAVRSELDAVRALMDRSASLPDDSGEADACVRAGAMLSQLQDPPWWRHVAFSLLEGEQVESAQRTLARLRDLAEERRANRAWWRDQSAAVDGALASGTRTVPDLLTFIDSFEDARPPHPAAGGIDPQAQATATERVMGEVARMTETQDRMLQEFAAAAERVTRAPDLAAVDAALAAAPDPSARDLNPPELELVRERIMELALRVRVDIALRDRIDAELAAALSRALALDAELATAGEARDLVLAIEAIEIPDAPRYVAVSRAKAEALDAARRRTALLESRDLDRQWLEGISGAAARAVTARDAIDVLERLNEQPPGSSGLPSVSGRISSLAATMRLGLQARRDRSRQWREALAEAVDAVVAARTMRGLAESADHMELVLSRGDDDPSSSEDAQAARAARAARGATVARLVRQQMAPLAEAVERMTDPRTLPPDVEAALAPGSPLASVEEAQQALAALRARVEAKRAEFEAFDGAIARARTAMESGDICAAADALAAASPRDAQQEWMRNDMRGALAELAVEVVESLVLSEGSLSPGSARRLEQVVQCTALAECAPEAVRMAQRVWMDMRSASDRTLWEDCRTTAREALERRDATTYVGALTRYLSSRGSMGDAARAALEAFAVPVSRVVAAEFRWGSANCAPTDVITDLTIAVDGEVWSGPIPTGGPGRVARLSREWELASGADVVLVSASGVNPCSEPMPFAGLAQVTLSDRRFGALLACDCAPLGESTDRADHTLVLRVSPSPRWLASLALPPWTPFDDAGDGDEPAEQLPPRRPESDTDGDTIAEPMTGMPPR